LLIIAHDIHTVVLDARQAAVHILSPEVIAKRTRRHLDELEVLLNQFAAGSD